MSATTNQVLQTNGSGADPSWVALINLLDSVFGSAQGNILYRSSSAWTILSQALSAHYWNLEELVQILLGLAQARFRAPRLMIMPVQETLAST